MRRFIIGLVVLALLGAGAFAIFGRGMMGAQTAAPAPQPTALPPAKASGKIVAEAVVVPAQSAKLSMSLGGTVAQVNVKIGDRVQAGQAIAKLDTTDLENAVKRAEASVTTAEAQLAKAKAAPRSIDITAAEAKVAVAEAGLKSAQGRLVAVQARAGDTQAAVQSAQGRLAAAQANLEKTTSGPIVEDIAIAERKIEQAKNNLWSAQSRRDAACGRAGDSDLGRPARDAAQTDCDASQATVQASEEGIRLAELELQKLKSGPRDADVKASQASITQNVGDLAGAQARVRASAGDIAAAEGDVANAQANLASAKIELDRAKTSARAEDVAVVEAQLKEAQVALATARAELDKATLKAPFAGAIIALDLKVGERIQPGAVVAQVADLSQWEIETTDLTEINVVRLKTGDTALVTFDAIPGLELPGVITRIGDLGENKQGDIVYTVVIKPNAVDERLRWRMTASATFEPK